MSNGLLGPEFRLIPEDADRGWPQTALESAADEFVGRSLDEQRAAIQRLIGVLIARDFHREVTAAGRPMCEREQGDVVNELREKWSRIAFGGGINADARRIADKGLRAYGGDIDG